MGSARIVVVFDFDQTIIEPDSDNWVLDNLGATALFNQLLPTMPWNALMDRMMKELHARGKTIQEIKEVLRKVPMHPKIASTIKQAHSLGCDLRIVSDANIFFIETILEHVGIKECFSEINTNPSCIDGEGRLRIYPYHSSSPHGCSLCPPNMCKGMIIERIQASTSNQGKKRMIYLGDGKGDFCPSLRLKEGDVMMPRKGFPVWELICENQELVRAQVLEWMDGEEQGLILLKLLNEMNTDLNSSIQSMPDDCKFGMVSMAEALPTSLKV